MKDFAYSEIGQRIKLLRKQKGWSQTELADLMGKSLRTVQKYETGEIEVSIAIVNQLAGIFECTPTYLLGYEVKKSPIQNLSDIMNLLFQLELISDLSFDIDVKRPPRSDDWQCAIQFNGKNADAKYNADMCLFLEQWEEYRDNFRTYGISKEKYLAWQERTLAYYAASSVDKKEIEDLDEDLRVLKRREYLKSLVSEVKGENKI